MGSGLFIRMLALELSFGIFVPWQRLDQLGIFLQLGMTHPDTASEGPVPHDAIESMILEATDQS